MNDRPYDHLWDPTMIETNQGQNSLSVISEENESCDTNFTFAKSIGKGLDIQQQMNDCLRLSGTRLKSDFEIFLKNGFSANPDVVKTFEELIQVFESTRALDKQQCSGNDKKTSIPVSPQRVDDPSKNLIDESKVKSSGSLERPVAVENSTAPTGVRTDRSIPSDRIEPAQRNGFAEQISEPNFDFTARTTNLFPTNNISDGKPVIKQPASIATAASTDWVTSLRQKFQDSLSLSAKNFFDRTSSTKKSSEPAPCQFSDTNPFRYDALAETESTPLAGKNRLENPQRSPSPYTKNSDLKTQPPAVYQSGPVMYGVQNNSSNDRNSDDVHEIMKERQKLIQSKRVNVESWIAHGLNSNKHYSHTSSSYSAPHLGSAPVVNGTPGKPIVCNGIQNSTNTASWLPKVTPDAWLDTIDNAINFKKSDKRSPSPEQTRSEGIQEFPGAKPFTRLNTPEPANKTVPNQSVNSNTSTNGVAYFQDCTGRMIWSVKKIQISNRFVFLIIYQNEAWLAVEEFAAAFTNMSSDAMLKILNIQRVQIPFLKISRSDNSPLFNELDGTSLNVSRDHCNKIDQFLNLVPVKSALKILNKLNIVKPKQVIRASKDQVYPTESTVLYDIRTVINAWGQFQQEFSMAT